MTSQTQRIKQNPHSQREGSVEEDQRNIDETQ